MEKVKKLKLLYEYNEDYFDDSYQELVGVDSEGKEVTYFTAYNLEPEDAIIGRGIFDANNFVSVLIMGINLAREGYTSVMISEREEL